MSRFRGFAPKPLTALFMELLFHMAEGYDRKRRYGQDGADHEKDEDAPRYFCIEGL